MIFPSEEALSTSAGLIIQAAAVARASELLEGTNASCLRGTFFQSHKRHSIAEVYSWMGERIFWRAFRMSFDSFWHLHSVLLPHILTMTERATMYKKKKEDRVAIFPSPPFVTEKFFQACSSVPHCVTSLADHHITSCVSSVSHILRYWRVYGLLSMQFTTALSFKSVIHLQ